jgi:hypothetical protein
MKNPYQISKQSAGIITAAFLLSTIALSCTKTIQNTPQVPTAVMEVVDASPDAPLLDFYINGTQVNASTVGLGGGIAYFSVQAGKISATFNQTGTTQKLAADSLNLTANTSYTLFLANLIAKPDFILLKDTIVQPATGMCSLRFVDVSPDAPAVDLIIKKGAVLLTSNKSYKGYTSFLPLQQNVADTLEVVKTGTSTVLASAPGFDFMAGSVYNVTLYGLASQTNSEKLALGIDQIFTFNF